MKWNISGRGFSVLPELTGACVGVFPIDFVFARVNGVNHFVGVVIGQRRSRVKRPAAVVEAFVVGLEMRIAALGNDHFAPAERFELFKRELIERHGLHARGERIVKPKHQSLVEYGVDRSSMQRVQSPLVTGAAVKLKAAAPRFDILQQHSIDGERLIEQHARRVGGIFADGETQGIFFLFEIGQRFQTGPGVNDVDVAVPGRIGCQNANRQRLGKQSGAAVGLSEKTRRIDHRHFQLAAAYGPSEDRRTGGHTQPRLKVLRRAAADRNAHIAWAVIGRVGIAGDVQADFPEHLRSLKVCAAGKGFHCFYLQSKRFNR